MTTNENAPQAATRGAKTEPPTNQDQKESTVTIIAGTEQPRYVVAGTDVLDRTTGRIAKFENAGVAQIGADWLNGPDATPEDYVWSPPPVQSTVAKIRQQLANRGMTVDALAVSIGVTGAELAEELEGDGLMLNTFARIAEALGMTMAELA